MKSLHQFLKPLVRPLGALVFLLVIVVDLILLPIIDTFSGVEHSSVLENATGFWIAFGSFMSAYAVGRSAEKINRVEPEN